MNRRNIQPRFSREVVVAFLLSLVSGALAASLTIVLDADIVLRGLIAGLGLTYVLYRLHYSHERTGRIVVVGVWCALSGALWLLDLPFSGFLAAHVALVWVVRSLYAYTDLRAAAVDLVLCSLAVAFAVWAALRTESLFLAAWCFFLIQALHIAIPASLGRPGPGVEDPAGTTSTSDSFACAYRAAENALRRIAAGH